MQTQRLHKGDTVKVSEDVLRAMQLQEGHGGWSPEMHKVYFIVWYMSTAFNYENWFIYVCCTLLLVWNVV